MAQSLADYLDTVFDDEPSLADTVGPGLGAGELAAAAGRLGLSPVIAEWFGAANGSSHQLFAAGRLTRWPVDVAAHVGDWKARIELISPGGPDLVAPVQLIEHDYMWLIVDAADGGDAAVWLFSEDGFERAFDSVDHLLRGAAELLELGWVEATPDGVVKAGAPTSDADPDPTIPRVLLGTPSTRPIGPGDPDLVF